MNIDIVMRQQKFDHLRIPKGTCNVQWKAVTSLKKKQLICGKELSWAYNSLNHNYIKILESDWSSAGLISAVIGQLYASCLSNWTVRVIKLALVALEWLFFFRHVA